jgi:hypothetical protein
MSNLRKIGIAYKCGHVITRNLLLSRIEVELRFAETVVCVDCWINKKRT